MSENLDQAREHFIQGISRITHFWGFPKAMGAIYAVIYLSAEELNLDEIVKQVGVTKGAVSTNVRQLERLGMIHKKLKIGDRKDYYCAEFDFWKIVKGILKEREQHEFDYALKSVQESLNLVKAEKPTEQSKLCQERLQAMQQFFDQLDTIVATLITLDDFKLKAVLKILGAIKK